MRLTYAFAAMALLAACQAPACPSDSGGDAARADLPPTLALARRPTVQAAAGALFCGSPDSTEKLRAWRLRLGSDAAPPAWFTAMSRDCIRGDLGAPRFFVDFVETAPWSFSPDDGSTWLSGNDQVARVRTMLPPLPGGHEPGFAYAYADLRDLQPIER